MWTEAEYRERLDRLAARRQALHDELEEVEKDLEAVERVWAMEQRSSQPAEEPPEQPVPESPVAEAALPKPQARERKKKRKAKRRQGSGPKYGELIAAVRELVQGMGGEEFSITSLKKQMQEKTPNLLAATSTASISSTIKRLASLGEIEVARRKKGDPTVYRQVRKKEEALF